MKKLFATVLLLLPPLSAWTLTIDVYHTSDVHGWYSARPAKWNREDPKRMIGGFAVLSSMVKADKNPHILLDSGDTFQGTPEGTLTKGMATAALMDQLGYSACDVGNHDYDYTEASLRAVIAKSSFPWLGANVYVKKTGRPVDYLKPYTIVTVAGKRIAVLGLLGTHTATSTLPANVARLGFGNESEAAAKWVQFIRGKEHPDAVLILSHTGIGMGTYGITDISTTTFAGDIPPSSTLSEARASRADVVMGGHNHVGLLKGYRDPVSGALIAESYWGLTEVSKITLDFDDKTGKLIGSSDELLPLWEDKYGEDPAVLATIKRFRDQTARKMDKPVGELAVDLGTSRYGLDSPIGDWFTDAMRRQAGTDAAIQNTAGIRSTLHAGTVRVRDVFEVMPFENTLVTMTLTGDQLRRLMADNLEGGHSRLQVSGIAVRFKAGADGKPEDIVILKNGRPVGASDRLTVATNNYLTTGGTGGAVFAEAKDSVDTMRPIRDLLIKDMKENPVKALPEAGRIVRQD